VDLKIIHAGRELVGLAGESQIYETHISLNLEKLKDHNSGKVSIRLSIYLNGGLFMRWVIGG
jgi:hypothetical protein